MRTITQLIASLAVCTQILAADPLPSWNDTDSKRAIIEFVEKITEEGSEDFVPPEERIATFDNDGTLWAERPLYFQFIFAVERVKELAGQHPDWKAEEPFASILRGDVLSFLSGGEKGVLELITATHTGMTSEEFRDLVRRWLATARHPRTGRRYTEMAYQPMLELLAYLRAHGFKTFIVSGGGGDFIRVFSEDVYGIPPEQVVGTRIETKYEVRDGKPVIVRLPEVAFVNDKAGKPIGIHEQIGRRPLAAFGNSDGDLQMLQYTHGGKGPRFCLLVHHTDAKREWAYDRDSKIGRLDKALDVAVRKKWTVVDMQRDWKAIYKEAK